jgi:hypothetical protein
VPSARVGATRQLVAMSTASPRSRLLWLRMPVRCAGLGGI